MDGVRNVDFDETARESEAIITITDSTLYADPTVSSRHGIVRWRIIFVRFDFGEITGDGKRVFH